MKTHDKKDTFFAKIINDLKSPASAQIKALQLFLSTGSKKISTEERELIELTLNSCCYMQNLIETSNSIYKLENQQLNLYYSKFDIIELIKQIEKQFNILLKYYNLKILTSIPDEVIINADKIQIKRVVENIISNIINNSYKDTTININASVNKNIFTLNIENTGTAINQEELKKIFEKFRTMPANKTASYLGLYLSGIIINAHYGNMIIKNTDENKNLIGFQIPIN